MKNATRYATVGMQMLGKGDVSLVRSKEVESEVRYGSSPLNVKYLCFTWEERNLEIDTSIESWKILDKLTVFNQKITTRDVTQMIVKWRFQRASNRSRGRSGRGGSRQNTRRDSRLNRGIEENPRMKIDDRSRFNSEGGRRCRIEGTRASGDGVN